MHNAVSTVQKQEMTSSVRLQHYDVTSCKQRHLIVKHNCCKGVSILYKHRKFRTVSAINEGVIAFSKKVHVFLRHPVHANIKFIVFSLLVNSNHFCKGKADGFYRNPTDCARYYLCSYGHTIPELCPAGTYYSPTLKICNWIANVHCDI